MEDYKIIQVRQSSNIKFFKIYIDKSKTLCYYYYCWYVDYAPMAELADAGDLKSLVRMDV